MQGQKGLLLLLPLLAAAEIPEHSWLVPPAVFAESAHSFDVRHYRIAMTLPMTDGSCLGHTRIVLTSRVPALDTFTLMMDSLTCDSVLRGGVAQGFARSTGQLAIALASPLAGGESTAIDIYYRRRAGLGNRGFWYFTRGQNGHYAVVFTVAAPYDARWWFPCYDEPFDKAEQGCEIVVTAPDSFRTCANGRCDSSRWDSLAHTRTDYWRHRYPIATYLIVFATSNWTDYTQMWHAGQPDSVATVSFFWPEDTTWIPDALENVPDMMTFFIDSLGFCPYPFERYGHVIPGGFQYGGMENQTLTMLNRSQVVEGTISHELSHMWWGDMVTCIDYRNVWLNEGFAEYCDGLYFEHGYGHVQFVSLMLGRARGYFNEDVRRRFPTYNPPMSQVYALGAIYYKGAWIQHMLRYVEGDTTITRPGTFFRALRAYGDSFKYGGASTQDYERIHEQVSGLDLGWFFDEWLYLAGYPQYTLAWATDSSGQVTTNLSQNNGTGAAPVFHIPVQLKFRATGRETLVVLSVDTSPQLDTFQLSFRPTQVVFDPGSWVLGKATVLAVSEEDVRHPRVELELAGPTLGGRAVEFRVRSPEPAEFALFDAAGRCRKRMSLARGAQRIGLATGEFSPGVYVARLSAAGSSTQAKLIITR